MVDNIAFIIGSDIFDYSNLADIKFQGFVKKISPVLEVAEQTGAEVWYAHRDIKRLSSEMEGFDEYFTQSQGNFWGTILSNFRPHHEEGYCFKIHYSDQNTSMEYYPLVSFPTVPVQKTHKILLSFDLPESEVSLLLARSSTDFHHLYLNVFNEPDKIWRFVNNILPRRKYNFSSKHGDIHTKANPPKPGEKVSQLKCSKEDAEKLLNDAIFDRRYSGQKGQWCYNFDPVHDTFIIFPCEGNIPSNQFHAFHIERDEWKREVPSSVISFFNKNI
jgi:hypothetical protein